MWIYFSCENVFGLFCYRQWYKVVLMFKLEAMSGYPLFNFLPARLPPTSLLQMQTFTVSINSLWNILRGISEMRTSTGSVWVTPRRESIYLAVCCSKFNKGKKKGLLFLCFILKGFSRSASNLYATDVLFIPREINSLSTETMQNAILI